MKCPYLIKVCSKCKRILVACKNNFYKNKKGKYGFNSACKICDKLYDKEHKKEKSEYHKQYREEHKDELKEKHKQYYEENKEIIAKKKKQYREEHKEEIAKYKSQYYKDNKEIITKKKKQYREENPHIDFNSHNKRRQLEENQGRGITKEQWYEMMCWFDWCCAYSGEYLGNKENKNVRSIDHIVALDNNGLNEPWNCVPMYKSYNISKHANNMKEWYIKQEFYSEERLIKIYAWCEYAFNKWKPRRKGNKKLNFF